MSETDNAIKDTAIVVGVDGSDSSKAALRWAADEARLRGVELTVVTTWEYPAVGDGVLVPEIVVDFEGSSRTTQDELITEVLGDVRGLEVKRNVIEGRPGPVLVEISKLAALVVVGASGHGEIAGVLLGSTSLFLASHSRGPVAIVRDRPEGS